MWFLLSTSIKLAFNSFFTSAVYIILFKHLCSLLLQYIFALAVHNFRLLSSSSPPLSCSFLVLNYLFVFSPLHKMNSSEVTQFLCWFPHNNIVPHSRLNFRWELCSNWKVVDPLKWKNPFLPLSSGSLHLPHLCVIYYVRDRSFYVCLCKSRQTLSSHACLCSILKHLVDP